MKFSSELPCSLVATYKWLLIGMAIMQIDKKNSLSGPEKEAPDLLGGEGPGWGLLLRGAGGNSLNLLVHLVRREQADLP
jgi:hypothetical protein